MIDHPIRIILKNATFKVSERVRDRVRRTGRKEVHAGVVGEIVENPIIPLIGMSVERWEVTYNPYKNDYFLRLSPFQPLLTKHRGQVEWSCDYAILDIAAKSKVTAVYIKELSCA